MRRTFTILILIVSLLGWDVPVRPYTLQYTDASAAVQIHWPTTTITVAFSTSLSAPPANIKAGSDVVGAARRALKHWSDVSNIRFIETSSNAQSLSPSTGGDGVSLITVADTPDNRAVFGGERTGRTRVFYDPASGNITESDIAISPLLQFATDGTTGYYDLESTFTHELGHLLGLDHSGVVGATMQPRQGKNSLYNLPAFSARTLAEDDITAVRTIYGPRTNTGAISGTITSGGLPVYGAHVWAEEVSSGRVVAGNVSLANGTYRIESLPPGQYRVNAENMDGPVVAAEIASTVGAYSGIANTAPFRTTEAPGPISVTSGATASTNIAVNAGGPTINPRLFGINGMLSTISTPLVPNRTYTFYLGGTGLTSAQVPTTGISITSPYFTVNQGSVAYSTFTDESGNPLPVITFDATVSPSAPAFDYSIRVQANTGEVAYVCGGLTIDMLSNGLASPNPIDDAQFFVRQHYLDFLGRQPDQGGLDYWSNEIARCGADAACINSRRIGVSAAFFVEQEFQQTGSFVYRFYRASLGRTPSFTEFTADRSQVVAGPNLEQNKQAYALLFVGRAEFLQKYPRSMTASQFVDALLLTVQQTSGVDLAAQRSTLISMYDGTDTGRANIVRQVADNSTFQQAEYNRAFVLMQYFGYLRRDPDQVGFDFWLNVLNNRLPNDQSGYRSMVCAFITSAEYQLRFGTAITRTNADCAP